MHSTVDGASQLSTSGGAGNSPSSSSRYCIVMLGSGGVGKSALSIQYVQGMFIDVYDPTIMDSLMRSDTIGGRNVSVTVVDTAGQVEYLDQTVPYIRMADMCVFVYSITDASSFSQVSSLFDHALRARQSKSMQFVVVGNKTDLHEHRCVSHDQGRRLAVTLAGRMSLTAEETIAVSQAPLYLETTAKRREDAVRLFHCAVLTIAEMRRTGQLQGLVQPRAEEDDGSGKKQGPAAASSPKAGSAPGSRRDRAVDDSDTDSEHGPVLVMPLYQEDSMLASRGISSSTSLPSSPVVAGSPSSAASKGTSSKRKKKSKQKTNGFRCMML